MLKARICRGAVSRIPEERMSGISFHAVEERHMNTPADQRNGFKARLNALHDTGLLDSPPERNF